MRALAIRWTIGAGLCLALPSLTTAQTSTWDVAKLQLSRAELTDMLQRYELASRSSAYSGELRRQASREATLIRARLEEGDFQIGDQITLVVQGESTLSNTFIVEPGPQLDLPDIGEVPLKGVLRSELQEHLTAWLGRYLRDPVVQTSSSIRILISGGVGRPGFYLVPADLPLSDALMLAGGPVRGAKLSDIRLERGRERIWAGLALQEAIMQGRTLDQLSVRAGDRLTLPEASASSSNPGQLMGQLRSVAFGISSAVFLIGLIARSF